MIIPIQYGYTPVSGAYKVPLALVTTPGPFQAAEDYKKQRA